MRALPRLPSTLMVLSRTSLTLPPGDVQTLTLGPLPQTCHPSSDTRAALDVRALPGQEVKSFPVTVHSLRDRGSRGSAPAGRRHPCPPGPTAGPLGGLPGDTEPLKGGDPSSLTFASCHHPAWRCWRLKKCLLKSKTLKQSFRQHRRGQQRQVTEAAPPHDGTAPPPTGSPRSPKKLGLSVCGPVHHTPRAEARIH